MGSSKTEENKYTKLPMLYFNLNSINITLLSYNISAAVDGPVGFIGLGNMGNGMAKNLLQKGEQVVAFDVDKASLDAAVAAGAKAASSPAEVAAAAARIVTMLPNNDIVKKGRMI